MQENLKPSVYFYILAVFFLFYLYREGYFENIISISKEVLSKNIKLGFFLALGIIVLITGFDHSTAVLMKNNPSTFADQITKIANILGKGDLFIYPFVSICFFIALLLKKEYYIKVFAVCASSTVFAGILIQFIKIAFARARPRISDSPLSFFNYNQIFNMENTLESDFLSFASGDTITITALFVPLIYFIKNKFLRVVFIVPIVIVCFGRLYSTSHWLSDVSAGLILGVTIGVVFSKNKDIP